MYDKNCLISELAIIEILVKKIDEKQLGKLLNTSSVCDVMEFIITCRVCGHILYQTSGFSISLTNL